MHSGAITGVFYWQAFVASCSTVSFVANCSTVALCFPLLWRFPLWHAYFKVLCDYPIKSLLKDIWTDLPRCSWSYCSVKRAAQCSTSRASASTLHKFFCLAELMMQSADFQIFEWGTAVTVEVLPVKPWQCPASPCSHYKFVRGIVRLSN